MPAGIDAVILVRYGADYEFAGIVFVFMFLSEPGECQQIGSYGLMLRQPDTCG